MRPERHFVFALAAAASMLLSACGGGGGGNEGSPPSPSPSPSPLSTGTLDGMAVSAGNPASGLNATATIAGLPPATTVANGNNLRFSVPNVPASERVVVRVSSAGHLDTVKVVAVRGGATTFLRATLVPVGTTANIDTAMAAQVTVPGSTAQLDLPANAFVRADNGAPPPATVAVEVTPIDPGVDPERMPGDYTALAGATPQNIESFGALGIQVRDTQGNRYQLASGKTATIRIPVSSRAADLPATIPLFYLDEATGRWIEEGLATLGGSGADRYYEGTVSHFSYWNADRVSETIFVSGCVQNASGARVSNRTVRTEGLDYTGAAYAYSNSNGEFRVAMRKNSRAVLTVQGGTESTVPIVVGPASADITLPQCLVERGAVTAAPSIILQPADLTVDELAQAGFVVVADGALPLAYQWRRNGVDIPGATGPALTRVATAADNGAVFSVVITNAQGSVTSGDATLTVRLLNAGPPRILSQPQNATVGDGQQATFTVSAAGAQPLSYQWRRNGVDIPGATSRTYTTPALTLADSGARYSVVIGNAEGSIISDEATLTVSSGPGADVYKTPLARIPAGTYGGCTNAAGQAVAPIVVTASGDVTFEGGAILMSSPTSYVEIASDPTLSQIVTIGDSALDRHVWIGLNFRGSSLARVLAAGGSSTLINCTFPTPAALPAIAPTAIQLLDGTKAALSCIVQRGGTTTTESISLALMGDQATLGAISFSMSAPLQSEFAGASNDIPTRTDSFILYAATYTDESVFSISRYARGSAIMAGYVTATGDKYNCSGSRT